MKIDVSRIVIAQFNTMRNNATQKYSVLDLLMFYGAPLLCASLAPHYGWKFNADVLNALLTAFSIFAGLLLNLLLLVYTFSSQSDHPGALAKVRSTLVKELHDNLAYSILVSIVIVVLTMFSVAYLKKQAHAEQAFTNGVVTGVTIFLTLNFVVTLLMILKRIYTLLNREIERPFLKKSA